MEIMAVVTGAWNAFATKITAFLPMLIGALVVFIAGWIFARLIRLAIAKLLKHVRFDDVTKKAGVQEFLAKDNILKKEV